MTYEDRIESIRAAYDARIRDLLESIARCLESLGHEVDRAESGSAVSAGANEEWFWFLSARHREDPREQPPLPGMEQARPARTLGVEVTLCEQRAHEPDDDAVGITFEFDASTFDGTQLLRVAPWNYTERCWVDSGDEAAVEERWEEMVGEVDAAEIAEMFDGSVEDKEQGE